MHAYVFVHMSLASVVASASVTHGNTHTEHLSPSDIPTPSFSPTSLPQTPLPEEGLLLVDDFIVLTIKNKRKRPQQLLTVFLHEDCLILTKEELKDPIHPPTYHFQDQLLCSELSLTENYKTKDSKLKFAISSGPIAAAETVHVLQPAFKEGAEELKDKWTRSISDLLMRQLETTKGV